MPSAPTSAPFRVVSIPLNREAVVTFLTPPEPTRKGASVRIVAPRPSVAAEAAWAEQLRQDPSVASLLRRDHPAGYVRSTTTDRLVPVEFLQEDSAYLTRNMGGWSPVWFGVMQGPAASETDDPVLRHADVLTEYGAQIRYFGASPEQVAARLETELGTDSMEQVAAGIVRLHDWRAHHNVNGAVAGMTAYAEALYTQIVDAGPLMHAPDDAPDDAPPVPRTVLVDELLGQMVRIEARRRQAVADGAPDEAAALANWQQRMKNDTGLMLILKGEYIMGRHRCSTVLIAPALDLVAKQPGPEPFHEIELGAATHNGRAENRPVLTRNGALVTAAGRLRLILEEGLVEPLNRLFGHNVTLVSSLGYIQEPYVDGPTLKEHVLADPDRLTSDVYELVLFHQLVCERAGVENGDWHADNFMVDPARANPLEDALGNEAPGLIHIDWGAARPLSDEERTNEAAEARMNQVKNIAYSYQDEAVAARSRTLHDELVADAERLASLRRAADDFVAAFESATSS